MGTSRSKEQRKEEKARLEAINRQRYFELREIRQEWSFVFGTEKPRRRKELSVIKDVTLRNVWMVENYLFNKIKELRPDELFYPIETYALKWTPPGSAHQMLVPLDDPAMQEMLIVKISYIPKKLQKRLLFFFAPRSLNMSLFMPKVHPASLVSYHLRSEVLQKLCDQFLEGRMLIAEFESIVGANYDVWKSAMFNLLPEDEQPYHLYLTEKPAAIKTLAMVEADYLQGRVPLQDFYDAKFPERKAKKDAEALSYPRPPERAACIVCRERDAGVIKCHVCDNKICVACVHREYLDPATRVGSFLVIHRQHCLKLALLRPLHPVPVLEPGYLRELRATGWGHAMEILGPLIEGKMLVAEEAKEEEEDDGDDEEQRFEDERRRREEEAERLRQLQECPPELAHLQRAVEHRRKKLDKLRKAALEHQANIDEPGHTEQYEARQRRLRDEVLEKIGEAVETPLHAADHAIQSLGLDSDTARSVAAETRLLLHRCRALREIESVEGYHESERAYEEEQAALLDAERARLETEARAAMAEAASSALRTLPASAPRSLPRPQEPTVL